MKANIANDRLSAAQSMTPEGETGRVAVVHGDLAAKRNQQLEKEVARLRELLSIEREINSAPRRAGRAEALEIIARIDPMVVIERMTEDVTIDGHTVCVWRRAALESVLGVTPGNAVQSLTRRMEDAIGDATASLNLAHANLAALERTLQAALNADADAKHSLDLVSGIPNACELSQPMSKLAGST